MLASYDYGHYACAECRGKMDVAFVMDSSGSVSREDFTLTLQFAAAVSQALPVGVDEARVGMVVFSSTARVEMYLKDHSSSAALAKAILATQYSKWNIVQWFIVFGHGWTTFSFSHI